MSLITDVKSLARRFRKYANILDALIEDEETPEKAKQVRQSLVIAKVTKAKTFSYKGKHWTQRPENRARVVAMAKARAKMRKAG